MGGTQTVWGPLFGAIFFTLVPEGLRKMSELDASLKFLEGGRYILFGLAVVLISCFAFSASAIPGSCTKIRFSP